MNAISALSPRRFASLIIRVYPPVREATFSEISRNKIVIASLSFKYAKTVRRECVVSFFDFVIKGSTYLRNALALAKVVVMRLCLIKEVAMLANIALR